MMCRLDVLSLLRLPSIDLKFLFISLFLWTFGLGLYNYVWVIYLRQLGAAPSQVGLVYLAGFLAAASTLIPGGLLANRIDLKPLILLGWAESIPTPIVFYLSHTWIQAIPGYILIQLGSFSVPAFNAYIASAASKGHTSSAFGAIYAAAPLGVVLSPAVGSLLLTWIDIRSLFLISAFLFTVSTIVLIPIKPQPPLPQDPGSTTVELPKTKNERVLLLYLFAAAVAWGITSPFLPYFYKDLLVLTDSQVQLAGAVQSLGGVSLAIYLGRLADRSGKGRTIAFGLLATTLGLLGLIFLRNPFAAIPFIFLVGAGRSPSPVGYSSISSLGGSSSRGGRFGIYLTLETLGLGIGPYLGGFLYGFNPTSLLTITSISFMALAGITWLELKN